MIDKNQSSFFCIDMNRKTTYLLISSFLFGILIMLIVFANYKQAQNQTSGFTRIIKSNVISQPRNFDLGYNSFYIAGISSQYYYLGNFVGTTQLLRMRHDFEDTTFLRLTIPTNKNINWSQIKVRVDYPNLYVMDGTAPQILHSVLPSLHVKDIDPDYTFFTEAIPISSSAAILKVFDQNLNQFVLTKKKSEIPYRTPESSILEKQVEGHFSVDGLLEFEPKTAQLAFLYFYRNQFITLDTALNIVYKGNTIDTVNKAQIKVEKLKSKELFTMTKPPLLINKKMCLSPELILIHSARKADNDDQEIYDKSSVIDVYSILDGDYVFSFYLPNFKNAKLRDFKVYNDQLIVIFDQYICIYKLNFLSQPI